MKEVKPAPSTNIDLSRLAKAGGQEGTGSGLPPVELWNPEFCGDLNMRIALDGTWFYEGTPIGRKRLVKLFSRILRHDEDGKYYLVTPVEKVGLIVEDAPFIGVEMRVEGEGENQVLQFRTNVDDWVRVDPDHALRFEVDPASGGLKPYVLVRGRLEALVARAVYYDLAALGVEHIVAGVKWYGVWSCGIFFPMARADDLAG
jgi:uncharacterized protein